MTELQHLIYEQLLELYIFDLEIEVLSEKLKNIQDGVYNIPPVPPPYPWQKTGYSEKYDATYDIEKNEWLDGTCSDPECEYCVNRPERPL